MEFNDIKLISYNGNRVKVQFSCSKGSFVRAWAKALGQLLGCGATVETLRRIQSQPYSVKDAKALAVLEDDPSSLFQGSHWIPLNKTLPQWPSHKIEGMDEKLISNGLIPRKLERFLELEFADKSHIQGVKLLSRRSNQLISLLSYIPPTGFKIRRVFPNNPSSPTISG
jgi:tRNA U55 pseudouridine synthase TruB